MRFRNSRKRPQRNKQSLDFQALEARQLLAAATVDFTLGQEALPSSDKANAYLFVGDWSGSNSERWGINIDGKQIESEDYGEVERIKGTFERGQSYELTATHLGTNRAEPDYDYRLWADKSSRPRWTSGSPVPASADFFVTDDQSLFQRRLTGSSGQADPTTGKQATIHFPAIDLDTDSGNSGFLDRSRQEDNLETDSRSGTVLPVYLDDFDQDGIADNYDFDGIDGLSFNEISVDLSANLAALSNATAQITFDFEDAGLVLCDY